MQFTYDVSRFQDTFEHEYTYLNGFMRNVTRYETQPALFCPLTGRRWNYRQLNEDANRLAHAMGRDGVGRGDVVLYLLLNSPEFVFCYLASQKLGAVGCPANYRQSAGGIAAILDDSRPKVFVYDAEFRQTAQQALRLAKHRPQRVVVTGLRDEAAAAGETAYGDYVSGMPSDNPRRPDRPHIYEEVTRLYTSGTTGRPKAVPINSINEVLSSHDVMMHFPLTHSDRTMNMTPWFHRGGLHAGGPTPTLYAGGEVVVLRDFSPRRCLQYVERYKLTYLIGVPTIIAMLARAQADHPADLSSLRGIVSMGAPFERAACEQYRKLLTPRLFNGYGTTESFWNTILFPDDLSEMSGSAGRPCTDDEVRVVHPCEDGHADPDDLVRRDNAEVGEILIKSPAKSAYCYCNNPEMTAEKFANGYLYTGDLGTWDSRDFITIVGRKDDMIVSSGENIFPTQVEAVLDEHPKVLESAVVGEHDPLRGQVVAAYVVPADDSLTVGELKAHCAENQELPPYARPRAYHLVKALPHTATGKVQHNRVGKTDEPQA